MGSRDSSVNSTSSGKARCNADASWSPWCSKAYFFQSQLSVQTLLQCPYTPHYNRIHQHYVHIVQNPKRWQPHHCLDTWKHYTLVGMGSTTLVASVRQPEFTIRDNEVLKKKPMKTAVKSDMCFLVMWAYINRAIFWYSLIEPLLNIMDVYAQTWTSLSFTTTSVKPWLY